MSHDINLAVTLTGPGFSLQGNLADEGGEIVNINEEVAADATINLAIPVDVSQLQAFALKCTRSCTVQMNSTSSPSKQFDFEPGEIVFWTKKSGLANPFGSTDITAIYVVNNDADNAGVVTGAFVTDPTI